MVINVTGKRRALKQLPFLFERVKFVEHVFNIIGLASRPPSTLYLKCNIVGFDLVTNAFRQEGSKLSFSKLNLV